MLYYIHFRNRELPFYIVLAIYRNVLYIKGMLLSFLLPPPSSLSVCTHPLSDPAIDKTNSKFFSAPLPSPTRFQFVLLVPLKKKKKKKIANFSLWTPAVSSVLRKKTFFEYCFCFFMWDTRQTRCAAHFSTTTTCCNISCALQYASFFGFDVAPVAKCKMQKQNAKRRVISL